MLRVIVQDASPGRSGGMVGEMGRSEKSDSCTKDAVVEGKMFHIYRRDGVDGGWMEGADRRLFHQHGYGPGEEDE